MKTHELKLDIKYFNDVKSGKKNFEIRKNDRDFRLRDNLKLIACRNGNYVRWNKNKKKWVHTTKRKADKFNVKILNVMHGIPQSSKWADSYQEIYIKTINKVLNDYFSTDRLPDGYVILGIEGAAK